MYQPFHESVVGSLQTLISRARKHLDPYPIHEGMFIGICNIITLTTIPKNHAPILDALELAGVTLGVHERNAIYLKEIYLKTVKSVEDQIPRI